MCWCACVWCVCVCLCVCVSVWALQWPSLKVYSNMCCSLCTQYLGCSENCNRAASWPSCWQLEHYFTSPDSDIPDLTDNPEAKTSEANKEQQFKCFPLNNFIASVYARHNCTKDCLVRVSLKMTISVNVQYLAKCFAHCIIASDIILMLSDGSRICEDNNRIHWGCC